MINNQSWKSSSRVLYNTIRLELYNSDCINLHICLAFAKPAASIFPAAARSIYFNPELAVSQNYRMLHKNFNQNSVIFEPFDTGKFMDFCKKQYSTF